MRFEIKNKLPGTLARTGEIETPNGVIKTPAFVIVGTKATVKSLTPEDIRSLGGQVVLANTYHLYLEPGDELVRNAGGLHKFMNWDGPTITDSGGFQVFSLGEAFGKGISKLRGTGEVREKGRSDHARLMDVDEDGVSFRSHIDGSKHRFTPEKSIEIQHNIGADIIFAFDECTSPTASEQYQREAMERTHRWAERSLRQHQELNKDSKQALFGIVQGGRFEDLRKESAKTIGGMEFDGFGIGGSFDKGDIAKVVGLVNRELPEQKPRHLLGIGEPEDLFLGIENGVDTFDCVAPTRIARTGMLYTARGRINIKNAKHRDSLEPVDPDCECYTCQNFNSAYLAHLFRSRELLGYRLASIHNLYFIVNLVENIRESIDRGTFSDLKSSFLSGYRH